MLHLPLRVPISKRIFDVVISLAALVILSPILLLISMLVLAVEGPPLFFWQERPGLGGRIFKVCKFRTMKATRGPSGMLLPDEERITELGRFLRRTSLDELPELFNVIKGEMSLVGPRPLLVQYIERYSPEQARRHEVLPGITGWAQVNGRNAITWDEKFRLDVWYVDHWSFWLDIRILLITLWKVLTGEGISQPGRATMDEFMGNGEEKK
ncbi:MAG: sugar transferase [Anaerolineaceae bacterium]|jgi:lipopolysaccharide/colanic/teichoic acid biosynthesis glycosyltransferase|nr:sugar transferase [Anaerolineaceae bacterium]